MSRAGKIVRAGATLALAAATSVGTSTSAKDQPAAAEHVYGPPPAWATYRQLAEMTLSARLVDPDSAKFSWATGFYKGNYKPSLSGKVFGYVACGLLNARNRMGGYTGYASFVVVIDYDRVLYAGMDNGRGVGMVGMACEKAKQQGLLPPLPDSATDASGPAVVGNNGGTATLASASSGLTLRVMPDGAYVSAVAPGSPGAAAGLKPGMVVSSVNSIPLAGMGDAMLKVVDAAGAGASLALVGGTTIKLGAKP